MHFLYTEIRWHNLKCDNCNKCDDLKLPLENVQLTVLIAYLLYCNPYAEKLQYAGQTQAPGRKAEKFLLDKLDFND